MIFGHLQISTLELDYGPLWGQTGSTNDFFGVVWFVSACVLIRWPINPMERLSLYSGERVLRTVWTYPCSTQPERLKKNDAQIILVQFSQAVSMGMRRSRIPMQNPFWKLHENYLGVIFPGVLAVCCMGKFELYVTPADQYKMRACGRAISGGAFSGASFHGG